jgi:hypothetical protein
MAYKIKKQKTKKEMKSNAFEVSEKIKARKKVEKLISKIEGNTKLYNSFNKWLDKKGLDFEFVLYEDSMDYPEQTLYLYNEFVKSKK